jgi:amino acid transporter
MMVVAIVDQALYPLIFIDYLKVTSIIVGVCGERWCHLRTVRAQEVVSLDPWQAYLVCLVYIGFACFLNIMGPKIIDKSSQFFSLSSLFPFVLFVILGLFSSHFTPANLVDASERKTDWGLYLSVLIWATCGYEYSGFLAG